MLAMSMSVNTFAALKINSIINTADGKGKIGG